MSKILISGYYGFDNLGDELILKAIIENLHSLKSGLEITIISANPLRTMQLHPGVSAIRRGDLLKLFKEMRDCQLFISGGGGLLQDATGRGSVCYYLGLSCLAKKLFGKKVMLYAQGMGPLNKEISRFLVKHGLKWMDLITLRDERSFQFLRELGVAPNLLKVTADPVLGLDTVMMKRSLPDHKLTIGVVLRKDYRQKDQVNQWCQNIELISKKYDADIWLLPFQNPHDLDLSYRLKEKLKGKIILKAWRTLDDIFLFYQDLDVLISMRLHALIIAALSHKLMIGVNYDPKLDNFLQIFDQRAITPEQVLPALEGILSAQDNINNLLSERLAGLQFKARENAKLAIGLIS